MANGYGPLKATSYAFLELVTIGTLTTLVLGSIVALSLTSHAVPASITTALGALIGWLSRSAAANGKDAWLEMVNKPGSGGTTT